MYKFPIILVQDKNINVCELKMDCELYELLSTCQILYETKYEMLYIIVI